MTFAESRKRVEPSEGLQSEIEKQFQQVKVASVRGGSAPFPGVLRSSTPCPTSVLPCSACAMGHHPLSYHMESNRDSQFVAVKAVVASHGHSVPKYGDS